MSFTAYLFHAIVFGGVAGVGYIKTWFYFWS